MENSYTDPVTGKFLPGNPGGGRPIGVKNFTTKIREAIEVVAEGKEDNEEKEIIRKIIELAKEGNPIILKLLWNYFDGMPTQKLQIDDPRAEENRQSLREIADVLNTGNKNSETDS